MKKLIIMKRLVSLGLVMTLALSAAGCGKQLDSGSPEPKEQDGGVTVADYEKNQETQPTEEIINIDEPVFGTPIFVRSGGVETEPYVHFVWAEAWDGECWISGDGALLEGVFSDISGELPEIVYGDDFEVIYNDGVTLTSVNVYNAELESICKNEELSVIEELAPDTYYLGIAVTEQGRYIESEDKYEATGSECLYKLIKE